MRGEFFPRGIQRLGHLTKDVHAPTFGLIQSNFHDFRGDRGNLDVHLQGRNALSRARYLEVHITEVIFVTQDVGKNSKPLPFLDQTHSDARTRPLQRHTGVHHGKRCPTNRRHRRRTVGFGHFRKHADGVREVILCR